MTAVSTSSGRPRISIVTPSFNQGRYLARTIESILSQGYDNVEMIVIDGGSTDESVDIIRQYEKHLTYWVSEKDRGQSHAINKGFERATGHILTWLNSDDWYAADALETFAEIFLANPRAGVVVGRGQLLSQEGAVLYDKTPLPKVDDGSLCRWLLDGHFQQPSAAFSREAWSECGKIDESIHMAMDLDFWLRIAKAGFHFVTTERLLSYALSHPGAKTTASVDVMLVDCARVIAKHGSLRGYEDLIGKLSARLDMMQLKLRWYERNYGAVLSNPLLRMLQPIVKMLSPEGRYWQKSVPPWTE